MTLTQFIAACLLGGSYEIPMPEFWRHTAARRLLAQCLRGVG